MTETIHASIAWPYASGDMHVGHLPGAHLPANEFVNVEGSVGLRLPARNHDEMAQRAEVVCEGR